MMNLCAPESVVCPAPLLAMSSPGMTVLIIIALYLSLLLGLGLFASRLLKRTSKDYMLASHSIGPFLLLMSLFGTTMTAFALVGSTGESFKEGVGVYGMLASSSGIIHSLCFFLIGVKLWSLGRRFGYTTQIQFFRDRLENDGIGLVLFPVLVGLVIPYLLIGVMAAGTVISSVSEGAFETSFAESDYGLPKWLGSMLICGVVLIYVFFGGMRGTAWANAFQTCVFMVLGIVTFVVISDKLGGLQAASEAVAEKHPSRLIRGVAEQDRDTFERDFEQWRRLAVYNYLVDEGMLSLNAEQKEQAHLSIKKGPPWKKPFDQRRAEADYAFEKKLIPDITKKQELIAELRQDDRVVPEPLPTDFTQRKIDSFDKAGWEKDALAFFGPQIGHPDEPGKMTRKQALGRYRAMRWAPEEPHGIGTWKFLTYMFVPLSVAMFPHLFQHWLTAKSASTFKLPVVAHPIFIMIVWAPCVLIGIWATSATMPDSPAPLIPPHFNANGVLAYMVKELTTPLLAGLLSAGILAAIMSSLDSQFLCLGTIFTEDIVLHYGGEKRFSEQQIVMMARLFIIGIVIVTYCFSLLEPRRVFQLGVWCFSGFSSLFPIVFAALYWRRLTAAGAYAGVLAAIISWGTLFYMSDFAKNTRFDVYGTMPVATMVLCSTAAMLLVSLVTKPPSEATIEKFFAKPKA